MRTYSIDVKNSFKTLYYKEENVINLIIKVRSQDL